MRNRDHGKYLCQVSLKSVHSFSVRGPLNTQIPCLLSEKLVSLQPLRDPKLKMPRTNTGQCWRVIALKEVEMSIRANSASLNIAKSTVSDIVKRHGFRPVDVVGDLGRPLLGKTDDLVELLLEISSAPQWSFVVGKT